MKKTKIILGLITLALSVAISGLTSMANAQTVPSIIDINDGTNYSGITKTLYATTYIQATCSLAYSKNSDTSNGTTVLGGVVQTPTATNDGKYYYAFNLTGLDGVSTYYYKIICTVSSQSNVSVIKTLSPVTTKKQYNGDGTYDLYAGDRIKLNNGATIEPIFFQSGEGSFAFYNVKFDVYDGNLNKVGTSDFTRSGWTPINYSVGGYNMQFKANSLGTSAGQYFGNITFSSISNTTQITINTPNSGESFTQGNLNLISWLGGSDTVQIGVVKAAATLSTLPENLLGWINTSSIPNSSLYWDGRKLCDLTVTSCWDLAAGSYKIIGVSKDQNGNYLLDSVGNNDISDNAFNLITPSVSSQITITTPNGGESFTQGNLNLISWTGGQEKVQIGILKGVATFSTVSDNLIGWINTSLTPNSSTYWDGRKLCDLLGTSCWDLATGSYKVVGVSKDNDGNYLLNSPGNLDISDYAFNLAAASLPVTSDQENIYIQRIKELEYRITELENQVIALAQSTFTTKNESLVDRTLGRILLQVETNGQAWYMDPITEKRYYLKDGNSAYIALNAFGLGITNNDLTKIPIGVESKFQMVDGDGDGLPDNLERAIGTNPGDSDSDDDGFSDGEEVKSGYNPLGAGKLNFDYNLANKLKGKILLQVQSKGEAWYVSPVDSKRYYLGDGESAYQIMRFLSLGITNANLNEIPVGSLNY